MNCIDEARYAAESRNQTARDDVDLVKCAKLSADAMAPIIGSVIGGGLGLTADMLRPVDEDEDKLGRRVAAILAGAALGGAAGHGFRQLGKTAPVFNPIPDPPPPPPPPKKYNPSWNTAIGTTLAALPIALLTRGKIKAIRAGKAVDVLGRKVTPELAEAIVRHLGTAAAAGSMATGATMIARNQFAGGKGGGSQGGSEKKAFFYSAPKGTDRNDVRYGLSKATRDEIYANTRGDMMSEADRAQAGSRGLTWQGLVDPVTGEIRMPVSWGSTKDNVRNSTMTPSQANFVSLLTKNKGLRDYRDVQTALENPRSGGKSWRTAAGAALAAVPLLLLGRRGLRNIGKSVPKPGFFGRIGRRIGNTAAAGSILSGAGLMAYDAADKGANGLDFVNDPSVFNAHSGKLTRHGMDDLKFAFKQVYGRDPDKYDLENLNRRLDRLLGSSAGANGNPFRFESALPRTL